MDDCDVAVIGGGLAGLTAAVRIAEAGRKVVLVEAGANDYPCNSRITMGFLQVALADIRSPPEQLRQAIARATRSYAAPDLAGAMAEGAGPALVWLEAQGVELVRGGEQPSDHAQLAPPVPWRNGQNWQGRSGDQALRRLAARLRALGGAIRLGRRARELVMERGRVVGLIATAGTGTERLAAGAVVIADGGFQANPDLVRRHIASRPERLLQRNAGSGRGDGLLMAEAAGAASLGLDRFYGHVQARDALNRPDLWPYPTIDYPLSAAIVVRSDGRRFTDEGLGGIAVANAIARLDDPLEAVAVFDQAAWEASGRIAQVSANPWLDRLGVGFARAASIRELATRAGLPADALEAAVAAFNRAIEQRALARLDPPRSEESGTPWGSRPIPIRRAPFYAVPLVAGITYTMGGLATDSDGRVLRADGSVIAGLYAAGASIAGAEGGPFTGYCGGLAKALVFGWRAGGAVLVDLS